MDINSLKGGVSFLWFEDLFISSVSTRNKERWLSLISVTTTDGGRRHPTNTVAAKVCFLMILLEFSFHFEVKSLIKYNKKIKKSFLFNNMKLPT